MDQEIASSLVLMWIVITGVQWHSPRSNSTWSAHDINLSSGFESYILKLLADLPAANDLHKVLPVVNFV